MTVGAIDTSNDALVHKEKRKSRKHSEKAKEVVTPDVEAKPQESSDKRIKAKHRRKEAETVAVAAEEMEEQATPEVSKRKKHHRHKSSEVSKPDIAHAKSSRPTSEDTQDAEPIDESKKKRKDKRKSADALGETSNEAGGADGNPKAKRKHKRKEKTDTGDEDVTEASAEKEKKKRKRKKDRVSNETAQAESSKDTTHETHETKKRKHSRSGFPNPGDDDEISDQSRKALVYAYVYAEDQPSWKFNKARQNWLVRNIWSDIAIPEKYFPLVKNYLSAIQGGAKETFVKTCQTFVQSAKTQNESQAGDNKTTQSTDVDGATPATAIPSAFDCKRHRAVELLHVFATSVAL